jgi:hypothetical protein
MFCTEERKEEFVVVTERERDRDRDAKEAQQCPPTSPVSENRLPFPPFRPCPPKNKPLPRKLPLTPTKKKTKTQSISTSNVQVFHQKKIKIQKQILFFF